MNFKKIKVKYEKGPIYIIDYLGDSKLHWANLADGVSALDEGDEAYTKYNLDGEHFLLSWKEVTNITVAQHYDLKKQMIHSFISIPNGDFLHFEGKFEILG